VGGHRRLCACVRIGPSIEICGCAPTNDDGSTVGKGDIYEQTRQCLRVIGEALAGVGAGFDDVTRTRIFHDGAAPLAARLDGRTCEVFGAIKPVTSLVGVRGLLDPNGWWRSKPRRTEPATRTVG